MDHFHNFPCCNARIAQLTIHKESSLQFLKALRLWIFFHATFEDPLLIFELLVSGEHWHIWLNKVQRRITTSGKPNSCSEVSRALRSLRHPRDNPLSETTHILSDYPVSLRLPHQSRGGQPSLKIYFRMTSHQIDNFVQIVAWISLRNSFLHKTIYKNQ